MRFTRTFAFLIAALSLGACATCTRPAANAAPKDAPVAAAAAAPEPFDVEDADRVRKIIADEYVKNPPSKKELFYGSIKGMVEALDDPYSEFIDPEEAKAFEQQLTGKFFGIGVTLEDKDGRYLLTDVTEGAPAAKAGLKPGDVIISVDGEPVTELKGIGKLVSRLRGPKGTKVKLLIVRTGDRAPREFEIVRDEVFIVPVKTKVVTSGGKTIMVVTLSQFIEKADDLFLKAAAEALRRKADGFILDLRNDGGGRVDVAQNIACLWIPRGLPYVLVAPRSGPPREQRCRAFDLLGRIPTVVLVNRFSASASEIVAGALQDHGKARLIGEKTFGKGCGQRLFEFPDGAMLKLTTFYWNTPKNRSIHKKGIEPDETVPLDPAKRDKDAQMDRAIEYLIQGH